MLSPAQRTTAVHLAVVAALSALVCVVFAWGTEPAVFWDTQSYRDVALSLSAWELPAIGMRTPGYPLFLLATGGTGPTAEGTVVAQLVLWCLTNCLVYLLVAQLVGRKVVALAAALVAVTFFDLFFMAVTVYAETLTTFFVTAATWFTARVFFTPREERRAQSAWAFAAGLCWALATLTRPVFLAAAVVFSILLIAGRLRRLLGARAVVCGALAAASLPAGLVSVNLVRQGTAQIALGSGYSLLNYVGDRHIYERLPKDQAALREAYETARHTEGRVYWWDALAALEKKLGIGRMDAITANAFAGKTALHAIHAVPIGYLRAWVLTAREFFESYVVMMGLIRTPSASEPQLDLAGGRLAVVNALAGIWDRLLPWATYGSLVMTLLLLAFAAGIPEIRKELGPARCWGLAALLLISLAVVLPQTLIEPCYGQARYRLPLQPLMLALVVSSTSAVLGQRVRSTLLSHLAARAKSLVPSRAADAEGQRVRFFVAVTAACVVGLIARACAVALVPTAPVSEFWSHLNNAAHLFAGHPYPDSDHPPGYPLFIGLCFLLSPESAHLVAVKIGNVLLGGLTIALAGKLARDLWGPNAGIAAAYSAALLPMLVLLPCLTAPENLFIPLMLGLALVIRGSWSRPWSVKSAVGAGILVGFAALIRSLAYLAGAFWLLGLFVPNKRRIVVLLEFGLVLAVQHAVMVPWGLSNLEERGEFTFRPADEGQRLFMGNSPWATGDFSPDWPKQLEELEPGTFAQPRDRSELDAIAASAATKWIYENPAAAARLYLKKLRRCLGGSDEIVFWSMFAEGIGPPDPAPAVLPAGHPLKNHFDRISRASVRIPVFVFALALLGLGVAIAKAWRDHEARRAKLLDVALVLATALYSPVVASVFTPTGRYRWPAEAISVLFVGVAVAWGVQRWRLKTATH
ncbi:MAG: glycosyltransferase family 39 protein [Myxococcales bacterium]